MSSSDGIVVSAVACEKRRETNDSISKLARASTWSSSTQLLFVHEEEVEKYCVHWVESEEA